MEATNSKAAAAAAAATAADYRHSTCCSDSNLATPHIQRHLPDKHHDIFLKHSTTPYSSMATPHLSLPPEIILKIIQWLPFQNGKEIASLKRVPYLKHLIEAYEHSITHWFMSRELRHAPVDFPYCQKLSLNWLAECVSSYDMIDAIMLELTWRENCVAIEPHNTAAANAGLLLLYRMGRIRKSPWLPPRAPDQEPENTCMII